MNRVSRIKTKALTRCISSFIPPRGAAANRATTSPPLPLRCASFALEPSCLVLAGSARDKAAPGAVGLTVWDVRYGVMLSAKLVPAGGDDEYAQSDAEVEAGEGVDRGGWAKAAGSDAVAEDGDVSSSADDAEAVFQITVCEDSSYVATASRARVIVTSVAARGASLLSATGRMAPTQAMLLAQGIDAANPSAQLHEGSASQVAGPMLFDGAMLDAAGNLDFGACIAAATAAASKGAKHPVDSATPWSAAQLQSWGGAVAAELARNRAASGAIARAAMDPAGAGALLEALKEYMQQRAGGASRTSRGSKNSIVATSAQPSGSAAFNVPSSLATAALQFCVGLMRSSQHRAVTAQVAASTSASGAGARRRGQPAVAK